MMSDYIVMGDGREDDAYVIYCRGSLDACRNKARRMVMHWNKDYFHPRKRLEFSAMSDKDFCDRYITAWFRSPSIIRLPKSKNK